jgi:hypothetical protein
MARPHDVRYDGASRITLFRRTAPPIYQFTVIVKSFAASTATHWLAQRLRRRYGIGLA